MHVYHENIDEYLMTRKRDFIARELPRLRLTDIQSGFRFEKEIQILPSMGLRHDTIFNVEYYDSLEGEYKTFREIRSPVFIDNHPFTLSIRTSFVEQSDIILNILLIFGSIIILMSLGIFYINRMFSRKIWAPFYQILSDTEKFDISLEKLPEISRSDIDEFERLRASIQLLMSRSIEIYRGQREFVENAAHELQTPVAVLRAKLDNLIQVGSFSDRQMQIITSFSETLDRLALLNKNLLLLSKLGGDEFVEKEEIQVYDLIHKYLDFFELQAAAKNITLVIEGEKDLRIHANRSLVEILITNLLQNAVRHNRENGLVKIWLASAKLFIANTGQAVPLDSSRLFSRFFKANPSGPGHGLGLAIVWKIARRCGWKVEYQFNEGLHTFIITF